VEFLNLWNIHFKCSKIKELRAARFMFWVSPPCLPHVWFDKIISTRPPYGIRQQPRMRHIRGPLAHGVPMRGASSQPCPQKVALKWPFGQRKHLNHRGRATTPWVHVCRPKNRREITIKQEKGVEVESAKRVSVGALTRQRRRCKSWQGRMSLTLLEYRGRGWQEDYWWRNTPLVSPNFG
jgi:hypothetical protein